MTSYIQSVSNMQMFTVLWNDTHVLPKHELVFDREWNDVRALKIQS